MVRGTDRSGDSPATVDHFQSERLRPAFLLALGNEFLDNVQTPSDITSQFAPAPLAGRRLGISPDNLQSIHGALQAAKQAMRS
jgi:hypothetical protein